MLVVNNSTQCLNAFTHFHGSEANRMAGKHMGIMSADKVCYRLKF